MGSPRNGGQMTPLSGQLAFTFADESVGENPGGGSLDGCARAFASHTVPVPTSPRRSDSPQTTSAQAAAPIGEIGPPCLKCGARHALVCGCRGAPCQDRLPEVQILEMAAETAGWRERGWGLSGSLRDDLAEIA